MAGDRAREDYEYLLRLGRLRPQLDRSREDEKRVAKLESWIARAEADLEDYKILLVEARDKEPLPASTPIVYLMRKGDRIKIGYSVAYRQTISAQKADEVLLAIEGSRELRASLLDRFAAHRLDRDWFADSPEIRRYIAEHAGEHVHRRMMVRRLRPFDPKLTETPSRGTWARPRLIAQKRWLLNFWYPAQQQRSEILRRIEGLERDLDDYRALLEESQKPPLAADTPVVYFVRRANAIKIGFSAGFRKRMYQLRPTEVLLVVRGGRSLETDLHKRFQAHSLGSEWFEDVPEIRAYIAKRLSQGDHVRVARRTPFC